MWTADLEPLGRSTTRVTLREAGGILPWREVIARWHDGGFADRFATVLADSKLPAFFWECPPVTRSSLDRGFEFVLVDSPALARIGPDSSPFARQFRSGEPVVGFPNLGRNALLVAPCPGPDSAHCAHLAAFVRGASAEVNRAFWAAVADGLEQELDDRPLWLSTSGLGVYWLHVRLDRRPKYYTHAPYRRADARGQP